MFWVSGGILAVVLFVGYTALLNAPPIRCPKCKRANLFRRTNTGRRERWRDSDNTLRRDATEVVCGPCGQRYWIIRDDHDGIWASPSLDREIPSKPAGNQR
jgi:hypothetical protein